MHDLFAMQVNEAIGNSQNLKAICVSALFRTCDS
jgi:hypothetical protein